MKINIIGCGVSGLSAGCYLQMNGFETELFEKNARPGGLCTSWKIGDYTFDGSAHWILGSGKGSSFYRMWSELLDMNSIPFHNHEVRLQLETSIHKNKYGNNIFKLYTNLNKLQSYMTDLSPEDKKVIHAFIQPMRIMQKFDLPPFMDKLPFLKATIRGIKMMKYLEFLFLFLQFKNQTNLTFAKKFKSPFLQECFEMLYDGEEVNMMVIMMPLSVFDAKSAGYPIGGSFAFAKKLEESYIRLGGKINYTTPVRKIVVEQGVAKALIVRNNARHNADIIVSATDWHFTAFEALDGKFTDKAMIALHEEKSTAVFFSVLQCSFGIAADLSSLPHFSRYPLATPLMSPDGTVYKRMEVHIYNYDPTLAPAGKTPVVVSFYTQKRDFWIDLRKNDREKYKQLKQDFLNSVAAILSDRIDGIKSKIEVMDLTTPATYYRHTNTWKGSVQGWLPDKNLLARAPVGFTFPGLKNFYYASQWNQPGGGLPIALKVGRDVAKLICKKCKVPFSAQSIKQ